MSQPLKAVSIVNGAYKQRRKVAEKLHAMSNVYDLAMQDGRIHGWPDNGRLAE